MILNLSKMRKLILLASALVISLTIMLTNRIKKRFINYVYVPSTTGPTDMCTVRLYGYSIFDNGEVPEERTASSIPLTVGCHIISIYPDGPEGGW